MDDQEAAEAEAIIEELTKPHPRQHLYARITADMHLAMKRFLTDHPEAANDPKANIVIDQIVGHAGVLFDLLDDYTIGYREGISYDAGSTTRKQKQRNVKAKSGSSDRATDSSGGNTRRNREYPSDGPTFARRLDNDTGDNRRGIGRVLITPTDEAKQPKRPERGKSDRHPAAGGEHLPGHGPDDFNDFPG